MKQLCIFLLFCISQLLPAQSKTEIRAAWLTVNYGLDWPGKPFQNEKDIEQQKNELIRILNQLQDIHINLVFLQTRIRGDVIYPSKIEPRSTYIKSAYATADYDPLSYAIEACRQRGIECHAWFVVYPTGSETMYTGMFRTNSTFERKNLEKTYKDEAYLDPGNPQTDAYLLSLVKEIVSNYDIDGIHFDYIRYPDNPAEFPDNDTYRWYGNGESKSEWRRKNINRFVYAAYDTVKALKPWVQVSSSVIGMYEEISGYPRRYWTASSVFQDPIDWFSKGKHDFIVPMAYFSGKFFNASVKDWISRTDDRFVVPGLGVFRMDSKESRWGASVIYDQVRFSREVRVPGNAFFRAAHLPTGSYGFGKGLRSLYYQTPAVLPPLIWLGRAIPNPPSAVSAYAAGSSLRLEWNKVVEKDSLPIFYNLYRSEIYPVDTQNPKNLLAIRLPYNHYELPIDNRIESGYYYVVTAFNRYHNESVYSRPAYFVTGKFEK